MLFGRYFYFWSWFCVLTLAGRRLASQLARERVQMLVSRLILVGVLAVLGLTAETGHADISPTSTSRLISIGTGGKSGVYYPTGGLICDFVNQQRFETGLRCLARSAEGSLANLRAIRRGALDFALAQSDWQYHAFTGDAAFKDVGRDPNLRSVFSLYVEPFTVIARRDAGIDRFEDLKGKRVNIGNPGSGQRSTMDKVMAAMGWTVEDFAVTEDLGLDEEAKALCDDKVDAAIFMVGHPNQAMADAINSCGAILIPLPSELIDQMVSHYPYYRSATILGGTYTSNADDIHTFGAVATFVTSARTDPLVVEQVVRAVFENFDKFRSAHPAFASLKREDMTSVGLTAPLHAGAVRYYREAGLLKH